MRPKPVPASSGPYLLDALANLRRMFRVRTNIFFVFVFPMVLILILGATFGGSDTPRLGVVSASSGPLGAALLTHAAKLMYDRKVKRLPVVDQGNPETAAIGHAPVSRSRRVRGVVAVLGRLGAAGHPLMDVTRAGPGLSPR